MGLNQFTGERGACPMGNLRKPVLHDFFLPTVIISESLDGCNMRLFDRSECGIVVLVKKCVA